MINRISSQGLNIISRFEGTYLKSYKDVAGYWTIGVGYLLNTQDDLDELNQILDTKFILRDVPTMEITHSQAKKLFREELRKYETAVSQRFKGANLTQEQFDALVSFIYNLGPGAVDPKKSTLARLILQNRDFEGAAQQFVRWSKAGGKRHVGLVLRRMAEATIFTSKKMSLDLIYPQWRELSTKHMYIYRSHVETYYV